MASRLTVPSASPISVINLGGLFARINFGGLIKARPMIKGKKLAALRKKLIGNPTLAITMPASAGPRVEAPLKTADCKETALRRSSAGTRVEISAARVG